MKTILLDRQNLLDISIQGYGNVSALFVVALANGISITDELEPGNILEAPEDQNLVEPEILTYYTTYNVHPVTGGDTNQGAEPTPKGIGAMTIKENFKVG